MIPDVSEIASDPTLQAISHKTTVMDPRSQRIQASLRLDPRAFANQIFNA